VKGGDSLASDDGSAAHRVLFFRFLHDFRSSRRPHGRKFSGCSFTQSHNQSRIINETVSSSETIFRRSSQPRRPRRHDSFASVTRIQEACACTRVHCTMFEILNISTHCKHYSNHNCRGSVWNLNSKRDTRKLDTRRRQRNLRARSRSQSICSCSSDPSAGVRKTGRCT
jgi:hypothetical protein